MDLPPLRVPLDYKPMPKVRLPEPVPERPTWIGKTLLIFFTILIIVLGVLAFVFKDIVFQNNWEHGINKWGVKYQSDSALFVKDVAAVNLKNLGNEDASAKVQSTLTQVKSDIEKVAQDLVGANAYLATEDNVDNLSVNDQLLKDVYKVCYNGRQKSLTLYEAAMSNSMQYVEASNYMTAFNDELANFTNLSHSLETLLLAKNATTSLDTVFKARDSALSLKGSIDAIETIVGYDSLKTASNSYQTIADGYTDIASSTVLAKKDAKLLAKGNAELATGTSTLASIKGQLDTDWQKWFNDHIVSQNKNAQGELDKVASKCKESEDGTHLDKESSMVSQFWNKLRMR